MQIDLSSRTAVVTGSTAGIGRAIAVAAARAGATVVVNGREESRTVEAARQVADEAGAAAESVQSVAADVSTAEGAQKLIDAVPDCDVLVNNAGIFAATPVFEITDDEWRRFFDVNVLSGVRLARHYAPRMAKRGWGRVLFVSSESAVMTPTEMVHYGMTKTAQLAVSRGMAQELKGSGVTVNSILPGPTLTPGVEEFIADRVGPGGSFDEAETAFIRQERPTSLLGRLIRPHEVAALAVYAASEHASATTGAALRVDGGVAPTLIP
ncbi:SDR family NAD(P)-dependent oxidoreductase [Saccharopolyspora sp. NPDC003752]